MNNDNHLQPKDYLVAIIEAGIGAIPTIGGPIQTLYFGLQNEKRFKRIESFYEQLNNLLKVFQNQIPRETNPQSSEQLIGIIETINTEVEKSKSHKKTTYFVNAYKNLLLNSSKNQLDLDELYIEILSKLTYVELELLALYFRFRDEVGVPLESKLEETLMFGSLNRLADFGLINKHLVHVPIGKGEAESYDYSIAPLGINFCHYILT